MSKLTLFCKELTLYQSMVQVFQLYCGRQCTNPCFPRVLLTYTLYSILSKPLAAFPHNHNRNNGQWCERMNPVTNGLSSILRKNIGQTRDQTSDLLFLSSVRYRQSYGALQLFTKQQNSGLDQIESISK